ncbi:MAG: glycoside hydrolase family 99-like domain-containing protein [Bacteroidales bacterium]|nr:glycoside hydrolase family 99-like domain-containing protein [Bacteroidales bacterium]MBN2763605.1 glycoside hydrolase family 99-like domain-containing protein [Bacteroidales bacterium]
MKKTAFLSLALFITGLSACDKDDDIKPEPLPGGPVAVEKTDSTSIWVHYMPWFETPATSDNGAWGIHWTMANMNPENTDGDGRREIASHYYPLIGPYASTDKDVIEYHLLLMKYSGIDGLIIDWYGSSDLWDYPLNRRNAEAVIDMLNKVGLTYAVTYEDFTLKSLIDNSLIDKAIDGAIDDFQYMEQNYFVDAHYIKIDNKPLLMIFGPQHIQNESDWTTVLSAISETPLFLSLWYESGELGKNAAGEYSWVYENNTHIQNFYTSQAMKFDMAVGSAYPGFRDYYAEGGWGLNMAWTIDHNNGLTLKETLEMAKNNNIDYLQLVTWNDFGEGTMIEPSVEFQFTLLEKVQQYTGVIYSKTILEKIFDMYTLRKKYSEEQGEQIILDKAFDYLVSLQTDKAVHIIDSLKAIP